MADGNSRRIVLYTSESALSSELFLYIYAHVAALRAEPQVVAVKPAKRSLGRRLSRSLRKLRRLGPAASLEVLSSLCFQRRLRVTDRQQVSAGIRALERPDCSPDLDAVVYVPSVNGKKATEVIAALTPAIVVQAGAGILKGNIIQTATLGVLNLHHGIAPLIRGMNSIQWGLWENRPEWIGSTVHFIDEGIDTGKPLAYFRVEPIARGDRFPSLFVRATEGGVANLVSVIERLLNGDTIDVAPPDGPSVYRSTFSGWKRLLLEARLKRARLATRRGSVEPGSPRVEG